MMPRRSVIAFALATALVSLPASAQSPAGHEAAEQAYRLQAEGDHAAALEQARRAIESDPGNGEYWALLAQEAEAVGEWREAAEAYGQSAFLTEPGDIRAYRLRAAIYSFVMAGDRPAARRMLTQAASDPSISMEGSVDWPMIAIAAGDDRLAQRLLGDEALVASMTRQQLLDAAYSAKRRGLDARAVDFFRQGLASERGSPIEDGQRMAIEREIALLSTPFVLNGQLAYAEGGRPLTLFSQPFTSGQTLQGGLELGYRPLGWRNGRPLTLFGRVFAATPLADEDQSGSVVQGWVGLQYKPLSGANLVVEASRLVALNDRALDDWGLRAAFSEENDLVAADGRRHWAAWRLYGDLSYLLEADIGFGTLEGRYGRAFAVDGLVFTPHVLAYSSFDSNRVEEWGTALGAGVSARRWWSDGRGPLAPSYVDLTMQYRQVVEGSRQPQGLFVVLSFGR